MAQKKKLQVFVSSTFTDLLEERQAAVEAILTAGHIPAGMELFAAGDEAQMVVIRRWIDESDVFLLILAGRYGTLAPGAEKSYVHLEYEHALTTAKPLFAVVIAPEYMEERVKRWGTSVLETEHSKKLREFRSLVEMRMVRFWSDTRDIKLAVLETLPDFATRSGVIGWLRADEVTNSAAIADEVARLSRENAELRERLSVIGPPGARYGGLTFEEFYELLASTGLQDHPDVDEQKILHAIAEACGDTTVGLLHFLWRYSAVLSGYSNMAERLSTAHQLQELGLVELRPGSRVSYMLTEVGRQFLLRLRASGKVAQLESYRIERDG
jgi:hypothetical protein